MCFGVIPPDSSPPHRSLAASPQLQPRQRAKSCRLSSSPDWDLAAAPPARPSPAVLADGRGDYARPRTKVGLSRRSLGSRGFAAAGDGAGLLPRGSVLPHGRCGAAAAFVARRAAPAAPRDYSSRRAPRPSIRDYSSRRAPPPPGTTAPVAPRAPAGTTAPIVPASAFSKCGERPGKDLGSGGVVQLRARPGPAVSAARAGERGRAAVFLLLSRGGPGRAGPQWCPGRPAVLLDRVTRGGRQCRSARVPEGAPRA